MTKVGLIRFILLFIIFISATATAQKVKYKDIFGLLNTKQYDQAEPFLKQYLKETTDNPNAFLFMGIIYHEKANNNDILKQTKLVTRNMDSAIFFYDKAYKAIDEKEIRKNKELYQVYNRRDLRTGEFGVKLSDIQFDLEKKMEGLRERIDRIKMINYYFSLSDSLYKKTNSLYRSLQANYRSEREMRLRANDELLSKLNSLAVRFDSTLKSFDHYKASMQNIGMKTGYNQVLQLQDIVDFKTDGISIDDFYKNEIALWDYKKFALKEKEIIQKEIIPIRDHLVAYDIEINKLREKLNKDSVSVKNELTKLVDKLLFSQLKKFDPDPLPMNVLAMKMADLEYKSTVIEHKSKRDSANVMFKIQLAQVEKNHLVKLDSVVSHLLSMDMENEVKNYDHFITSTYNNSVILLSYIKALKEYSEREKRKVEKVLSQHIESMRWIIAGTDSIPLFMQATASRFKPLIIMENSYTCGLRFKDSLNVNGYFYAITPSRNADLKIEFGVDQSNFKLSCFNATKALSAADGRGQIYFVLFYSEKKVKDKYPITVAKIYRSDGLAWTNNYQTEFLPTELAYKPDTAELSIKADQKVYTIDKNGKLIK